MSFLDERYLPFEGQEEDLEKWSTNIIVNSNNVYDPDDLPPYITFVVINDEEHYRLNPEAVEDMLLVFQYTVS